jgi:oligo-1,6-glucosidase
LLDRKKHKEAFVYGDFQEISPKDPSIFAYGRTSESGERWLAV